MSGTTPWLSSYSLATDYEERRAEYAIAEEHSLLTPSATSHTYYAASSEKPLPRINYGWRNHLASLGWRPKTLMPGFLLGFAMISVVILLTLEFMLRRSKKFGAIVFVSEETKFIDYCFTYGPQLFAILYSLLFGSIDHDLKRLEAFFQLSCRDGATAEDSLFLSYHYKMACFVPFFAFRHRHFAVLCSSCALVLCLLVVTPAAGTMFSKELNITRIEETTFRHITPQEGAMMWGEAGYSSWDTSTTAFAYKAYSQRYSQGLPTPFTGESYALFPFVPTDSRTRIENEEWVTRTTLVAAELDCLPGIVQSKQDPEDAMPGLNITQITSIHHRCAFYLPPELGSAFWTYTSFMIDIDFLQRYKKAYPKHKIRIDCPGKDQLLIGFWGRTKPPSPATTDPWGSGLPNYEKATAVFCKPKHYRHQVDVTVDSFGQVMRAPLFTTPRATYNDFNYTLWKNLVLGYGSHKPFLETRFDKLDYGLPDHTSQLAKQELFTKPRRDIPIRGINDQHIPTLNLGDNAINVFLPLKRSLTPYGLSQQTNLTALHDWETLAKMFSDAYRFLFAIGGGASELIIPSGKYLPAYRGKRKSKAIGYVPHELWTRVVQGCLCIIILLDIILIFTYWNRKCNIAGDPGTLASSLACVEQDVLNDFQDAEFLSRDQLLQKLRAKNHKYYLQDGKVAILHRDDNEDDSVSVSEERPDGSLPSFPIDQCQDQTKVSTSNPWELSTYVGLAAVLIISGAVILLSFLYRQGVNNPGFEMPEQRILYDFYSQVVPMVVTMLFEDCLVHLTSHVTYMWPLKRLVCGDSSSEPLIFNFEKRPPHLQIISGLKTRNYLLAALSSSVLLANILAVAVGGLLTSETMDIAHRNGIVYGLSGEHHNLSFVSEGDIFNPAEEHYDFQDSEFLYLAVGDRLGFDRRHPWTNDEFFFLPFENATAAIKNTTDYNYESSTYGIGVEIKCEPIPLSLWTSPIEWNETSNQVTRTIAFPTFKENQNLSLRMGFSRRYLEDDMSRIASFKAFNEKNPDLNWASKSLSAVYYELGPVHYPTELKDGDWDFYQVWAQYRVEVGEITINRPLVATEWESQESGISIDIDVNGTTINATNLVPAIAAIRCQVQPLFVPHIITVNSTSTGKVLNATRNIEVEALMQTESLEDLGIHNILERFKILLARDSGTSSDRSLSNQDRSGSRLTPEPRSWFSALVQEECKRKLDQDINLYENVNVNVQCLETVYKRLFAIYASLNMNTLLKNTVPREQPSTFIRQETRVVIRPMALYTSIIMLLLFLPVVCWTYLSLHNPFLAHPPTSLAGAYAAIYASNALDDLKGTQRLEDKEWELLLRVKGNRYMYGWSVGRDGRSHYGINTVQEIPTTTSDNSKEI